MNDTPRQATRLEAIGGRFDPWLLGAMLALASLGVVMVASASIYQHGNPFYYLVRHGMFLVAGAGLAWWVTRTELKSIEARNHLLLLGCVVLLLMVFVPGLGVSVKGAHRWINLGVSNFQVVEVVKVFFIVWLASYLVRFRDEVNATWAAMLKPLGVVVLLVALLLMQPDFGSSSLLLAITAGMLVLGGVNMPRMFGPVLVGLPILAVIAIAEPYRMRRLTSFSDPWADPFGSGYQLTNALMAIGRGEWSGIGLGGSMVKDGVPLRGFYGNAGEIGHVPMVPNGQPCSCGNTGCPTSPRFWCSTPCWFSTRAASDSRGICRMPTSGAPSIRGTGRGCASTTGRRWSMPAQAASWPC